MSLNNERAHGIITKRSLCCRPVSVHLSVCLSVTFVYCIQTPEDIVKHLSWPGSPITLAFDHENCPQMLEKEQWQSNNSKNLNETEILCTGSDA